MLVFMRALSSPNFLDMGKVCGLIFSGEIVADCIKVVAACPPSGTLSLPPTLPPSLPSSTRPSHPFASPREATKVFLSLSFPFPVSLPPSLPPLCAARLHYQVQRD